MAADLPKPAGKSHGDSKKPPSRFNFRACRGAWCDSKTNLADKTGLSRD
jgi:hypothetical protein